MEINKPITELPTKPSWVAQAEFMSVGDIRVPKRSLEERYVHFAIIPQRLFFKDADRDGYISIPAKKIVAMEKKLISEVTKQKSLNDCAARNTKGKELEKECRYEEAISLYEENIKPGCWPATHSFDRLLIIYRSRKDYINELRVCKRAISVFKLDKYKSRMEKIINLIKQR